ncbi:ABC transporter ATP-binding protein [Erysipelothrix sp. HDW6C]|uniref:ABC transporter ATP-binding protein n=1 Tax=Erysipelothrix sp. HDW6C TaxID=2714930 RepID=UPI00140E0540|nr:ABC transporter ATP-binding protein [Erysipelothrix sp. HDW6C]QIK70642.1 ABC transporter ATP-binding protein [Erysipelothrix sp. HDW6C]
MAIIQLNMVTKHYKRTEALRRVNLSIVRGEICGFIGKDEAGKSTLFKIIAGMTPKSSGDVVIQGNYRYGATSLERKNIGYVLNDNFFSELTIFENLEYIRKAKGIFDRGEVERVMGLLDLEMHDILYRDLSVGKKQRLKLAATIMGNPDILIFDEPTQGLDSQASINFWRLVASLNEDFGTTVLISSTSLGNLKNLCTKFCFMHNGRILETIERHHLELKSQRVLHLKVDATEKTCLILEQQLGITDYRVGMDKELVLYSFIDQPDIIAKTLVDNGIRIFGIYVQEVAIDDYYLGLIAGDVYD